MNGPLARYGWGSDFEEFHRTPSRVVVGRLCDIFQQPGDAQVRAWSDGVPAIQRGVREVVDADPNAARYTAILEYELPLDARRPDVVLLLNGAVVLLELKGKERPAQADLDQASAYARDLRCYHAACADRDVHVVLVPTRARGYIGQQDHVHIVGPDHLDRFIGGLQRPRELPPVATEAFLSAEAYRPLPSLVSAARELFHRGDIRPIHRARAATDPAVEAISGIAHHAARTRTRHLVLVAGVPGAGKTLVGLRVVHARFLDDLAVARADGQKPTAPAVFLSGNAPLVRVLQHELRGAGGGGRTFVRAVKDYVRTYSGRRAPVPPEHLLVFDEAQRAFDRERVAEVQGTPVDKSEPEHFIDFTERIPEWCVVVGLIGSGQEIHVGEEAGIVQWRHAIEGSARRGEWTVHAPERFAEAFRGLPFEASTALSLDTEIRFHLVTHLHRYVQQVLDGVPVEENAATARTLEAGGYHLRITRDLDVAKAYLWDRYEEHPHARFGIVASSRDRDLPRFDVHNDFQYTKQVKEGAWYGDGQESPFSCRRLHDVVTEFGAQGLELDAALLAWGTDFARAAGRWSVSRARGYARGTKVKNPYQLRLNAYRVLLTRGRDATVVFVPPLTELDETWQYLVGSGFKSVD